MNDGGPAFPVNTQFNQHGEVQAWGSDGMSLLDYFAAMSLQGIRSRNPRIVNQQHVNSKVKTLSATDAARMAYEDAEAMIAEHDKERP